MKQIECTICEGTGFVGPKNKPDTPIELIQVGCCNCSACNGTGKTNFFVSKDIDESLQNALRESATKIAKGRNAI